MEMQNGLRQVSDDATESDDEVTLHTFTLDSEDIPDDVHEKIDNIQEMVTAPTADDEQTQDVYHRKMSQQLFSEAYAERRLENLSQIRQIDQMRQRFDNMTLTLSMCLTSTLQQKIDQIRQMCSAFECYFCQTYSQMKDNCSNLKSIIDRNNVKPKPEDGQREKALLQSFLLLNNHYQQLKTFSKWIKQGLKPQITTLKKHFNSQIANDGKVKEEIEKYVNLKKMADKKYSEMTIEGRELLVIQNELYEIYEKTKQNRVFKALMEYWQLVEGAERGLLQSAKTLINEYLERYGQVYQKGPGAQEAAQIWQAMSYDSQAFFRNIWGKQDQVVEVYGKQIKSKQQMIEFFQWNWLDDVSDWNRITQFLIIKKYKCTIVKGKQQTQSQLVHTVDGNLLLLDKNKSVMDCIPIKSITVQNSNSLITLTKKQKSLFSSNKKVLRFQRPQQAEQFMFFLQQ